MNKLSLTCYVMVVALLAACSSVTVSDYESMRPVLSAEQFFDGQLTAHGVVKDRSGKVIRTFNADIKAYWQDGVGTLEEDFVLMMVSSSVGYGL